MESLSSLLLSHCIQYPVQWGKSWHKCISQWSVEKLLTVVTEQRSTTGQHIEYSALNRAHITPLPKACETHRKGCRKIPDTGVGGNFKETGSCTDELTVTVTACKSCTSSGRPDKTPAKWGEQWAWKPATSCWRFMTAGNGKSQLLLMVWPLVCQSPSRTGPLTGVVWQCQVLFDISLELLVNDTLLTLIQPLKKS